MKKAALFLSAVLVCGALACATVPPVPVAEDVEVPEADRVIEVAAERFLFTPSEVTVQVGETVEFRLTSEDTDHGFRIIGPGNINIAIPKRNQGAARAFFSPTEPGEYRFECSRLCGAGHGYMSGVIRVVEPRPDRPTAGGSR